MKNAHALKDQLVTVLKRDDLLGITATIVVWLVAMFLAWYFLFGPIWAISIGIPSLPYCHCGPGVPVPESTQGVFLFIYRPVKKLLHGGAA